MLFLMVASLLCISNSSFMNFLNILESLRLHPALGFMDRKTTQKTTLRGSSKDGKEMEVCLEVGTPVIIPINALHQDEKHFPEPHIFKPERFLPDNKDSIPKYAFLPFGEGPRICLGN